MRPIDPRTPESFRPQTSFGSMDYDPLEGGPDEDDWEPLTGPQLPDAIMLAPRGECLVVTSEAVATLGQGTAKALNRPDLSFRVAGS